MNGPYYRDESVTLWHGDCREVLPTLGEFDAAVTDPPYGVNVDYGAAFDDSPEYVETLVRDVLPIIRRQCKVVAVTPGTVNLWRYPATPSVLCWVHTVNVANAKNPRVRLAGPRRSWQPVLVYGDRYAILRSDLYAGVTISNDGAHPCPKPTAFANWLVGRITDAGQSLLDPFAGSGVFLRAAKDAGRTAVGIELSERYCEVIAKRLSQDCLDFGESA
jgi:site-specific DNA-methyltransferase (adenine-specific)